LHGNTRPEKPLWHSSLPQSLVEAKKAFEISEIRKAISRIRSLIPDILEPDCSLSRRTEIENDLHDNYEINALLFEIVRGLPDFDLTVEAWTKETQSFLLDSLGPRFDVPSSIDFGLKKGSYKKLYSQPIKAIYGEQSTTLIPVSTIHQIKGMTFDSLLLILSPNSKGANISIADIRKPKSFPSEKQRMIFVAMSRPRHLLSIGVPDTVPDGVISETLGDDVEII
jgi:DNA helicase-2/ATP-dependent DNA helicase PcrA